MIRWPDPSVTPAPMAPELETPRLLLRHWRLEDRPPFAAMNADPEVMRHFPAPLDRVSSDALADRLERELRTGDFGLWALEVKGGPRFIGFVGLARPGWDLPFGPCVEVGWRLAGEAWGSGYATEAARAALRHGFEGIGLDQIVSFTALTNRRSLGVMQRLEMHRDESEDFDHPALPPGHPLRRHLLCRLTADRWRKIGTTPA